MTRSPIRKSTLHIADFDVEVTRRRQKHMYLRLKPVGDGEPRGAGFRVCVSAPPRCSDARIRAFVEERLPWIRQQAAKIQAGSCRREREGFAGAPTQEELAQWRAVVEAFVPALVEKWAPILGVQPGKLAYRNMVSRWGSCNVKTGRICINVQLAAQPPECLEYVVVHELCHLIEANHGPRFHALLDAYLPHWREAERKLRGAIRR